MMDNTIQCLDHGYVRLRNISGPTRRVGFATEGGNVDIPAFDASDVDVPNVARKSFDQQDKDRTYDIEMKLARYLAENKHTTPFEFIQVWMEWKMPIFVARQFVRHRTQSIDEWSARYIQLPGEWYIPKVEDVLFQQEKKKQGGRPIRLSHIGELRVAKDFLTALDITCRESYAKYERAVDDGIAMEQARMFLHVNHYTAWVNSIDLHNLFHFLALRTHSHAQKEAQVYAKAVVQLLEPHLPGLMKLYHELFAKP